MKLALVIIDMLNDFVTGKLACKDSPRIISSIQLLLKQARQKHIPIFYVNDEHHKNIDHELKLWGNHAIKGTKGAQVITQLKPALGDVVIPKRHYSAFFETTLPSMLKNKKIDTLVIVGLQAHICVAHTIADAYQHGYKIIIPKDATTSFVKKDYEASLKYFQQVYNAKITTINQLIKEF
jgi:nicotinamidase-related amidase